jgi:predicted Zn-dependent protease
MRARRAVAGSKARLAVLRRRAAGLARVCLILGLPVVAAECTVSEEDERVFGEYEAAQVDSLLPLVDDTVITRFVTELGRALTATTSRADLDWRFTVVNTSEVNAFALPGGFVYLTRGLLETVDRFDQLAGVMGHEIGHVALRHSVEQLEKSAQRDVALVLLCTLTRACDTWGRVVAVQVGADALTAQYSQHDEAEADSLSVLITTRAGIDPEGIATFFEMMLAQRTEQATPIEAFFASHPTDQARTTAVRRQIAALGQLPAELVRDTPEFHAIQARLRAMPAPPEME